jgi:uncharacterized membrane protein YkvA (DUF1232 family)
MMRELHRDHAMRLPAAIGLACRRAGVFAAGLLLWSLCAALPLPARALSSAETATLVVLDSGLSLAMAPGVGGGIHRYVSRVERAIKRLSLTLTRTASVWLAMIASALGCLVLIGCASVADRRMLDLRRHGVDEVARDLLLGVRTFVRVLRDRRTPALARAVVVMAVVYWMLPSGALAGALPLSSIIDDIIVAVLAAKAFVALCPEAVIVANARIRRG